MLRQHRGVHLLAVNRSLSGFSTHAAFRRLVKSRKVVSPVIATLIVIAIVVIAAVLVYVLSTGMIGSLTGAGGAQAKEQLIIEAYEWTENPQAGMYVHVRNTGSKTVTIDTVYVAGTPVQIRGDSGPTTLAPKDASRLVLIFPGPLSGKISSGGQYTVKIVTSTGGVFVRAAVAGSNG